MKCQIKKFKEYLSIFTQNLSKMFSTKQLIFAGLFIIVFIITSIFVYKKDASTHQFFYKGSYKVLIGFIAFILILFVIKIFMKR